MRLQTVVVIMVFIKTCKLIVVIDRLTIIFYGVFYSFFKPLIHRFRSTTWYVTSAIRAIGIRYVAYVLSLI